MGMPAADVLLSCCQSDRGRDLIDQFLTWKRGCGEEVMIHIVLQNSARMMFSSDTSGSFSLTCTNLQHMHIVFSFHPKG